MTTKKVCFYVNCVYNIIGIVLYFTFYWYNT